VIRRVVFRPAAVRDLARLDRVVQARIDAALVRFAATGHGDVNHPISSASSALTTGVKPID
jgi:hypothetical protein